VPLGPFRPQPVAQRGHGFRQHRVGRARCPGKLAVHPRHAHFLQPGSLPAVDDISLQVSDGEIFGIIGPNGAGKTTLLSSIEGLDEPTSGEITVLGLHPVKDAAELARRTGIQLQQAALLPRLRVGEALELFSSFYDHPVPWRPLLERLGIASKEKTDVARLSGGERQRVFIALALVHDPELLFLDELTTALDPHAPAAGGSGGRRAVQRPGSSAAAVLTMTWTSLLTFAREPVAFVMGILYPLAMLVLFHTVFPWEIDGGITYSEYMLPVMITMGVLMTCLQVLAITVASERETGELKRLAVLPVPPWAYVVAKCMYNTVLALLNVVLLMVVGRFALGIDLPSSSRSWGLMILSLVLTIGACTALGMAVGRICPSSRAASGMSAPPLLIPVG